MDLGKNIRYSLNYVTPNPSPGDKSGPWTHVGTYQSTTVAHREALLLANQGYSVWVAGNTAAPKQVWRMGQPSGSMMGKGGAMGGGAAGGGAPAAVQAGTGQVGAGGVRFNTGAAAQATFVPERSGDFKGLDTFNPPDKLDPSYTPDAVNWDGFRKFGSRSNRSGTAKLSDDGFTVTLTWGEITAVANSDLTASTDYFTITKPDTDTHAFWFDTTGSDTEPAGAGAADESTEITTTGLTATQVAAAIVSAINTADIGLVANNSGASIRIVAVVGGTSWTLAETVTDTGFTINNFAAGNLNSAYEGLSICRIQGNGDGPDHLLLAFSDGDIGDSPTLWPTILYVVTPEPTWGVEMPIADCPGPTLTLAEIAGPKIRATIEHDWPSEGQRHNTVRQLVVRYSLKTFPQDIDGKDNTDSVVFASADRAAWTGDGVTKDTTENLASGATVFVSAWTVTLEGFSKPANRRLTIA